MIGADVAVGRPVLYPSSTTDASLVAPDSKTVITTATLAPTNADNGKQSNRHHLDKLKAHPLSCTMPDGLCKLLADAAVAFPLRIVVLDNSGSMAMSDGKKTVLDSTGRERSVRCTRWQELAEDVKHIATMSEALGCRTDLHMLNPHVAGTSGLSIGYDRWRTIAPLGASAGVERVAEAMRSHPGGGTPLTESIVQIMSMISPHANTLRRHGERVAVTICTDGLPNDRASFLRAMVELQRLPVWVVVRLCTDDDGVVEYWNDLDRQLEAPLEVLDDLKSEAEEIVRLNPFLNYAAPLHYARIFGLPGRLFDLIDEAALAPAQVKEFVEELLGVSIAAEPEVEPAAFVAECSRAVASVPPVLNPRTLRQQPWLDVRGLERAIRPKRCVGAGPACAVM